MKERVIGIIGSWASVASALIGCLAAAGRQLTIDIILLSILSPAIVIVLFLFVGKNTKLLRRLDIANHRLFLTLAGASKTAFLVDTARILALFGLGYIALAQHGMRLFSFHFGIVFFICLAILIVHTVIYPFLRRQTRWDKSYRYRKSAEALAINYAAIALKDGGFSWTTIRNIEMNALLAIKSYIEYKVWDRDGNNFSVNLLVRHPHDGSRLVCIQRTSPGLPVPTFYHNQEMPETLKALETGEPIYVSRFEKAGKAYKMIWKVPILPLHTEGVSGASSIGILSVNSLRPKHLDFVDDREALYLNLSAHIALLRLALVARWEYGIWDELG